MIKSMTGYGQASIDNDKYVVNTEIKTLNSKFLDINVKLSRNLTTKEMEIRQKVGESLVRGKITLNIDFQRKDNEVQRLKYNSELFKAYYQNLLELAESVDAPISDVFRLALQSPEVAQVLDDDLYLDQDWEIVSDVLDQALVDCNRFRQQEGKSLSPQIEESISNISKTLAEVIEKEPFRRDVIQNRIERSLNELSNKVDFEKNRFEQEIIYYLEKWDISEELTRLKSHLQYFSETLNEDSSQGKKLGFIAQEIGREVNTIGAKANDAEIQKLVVQMKEDLEKIKEQLLNIL